MDELTTRQWQLYKYLKNNYQEGKYISKKELADKLGYAWNEKSDRNGRDIEKDVSAINDSGVIHKVIISSHKGYKISSQDEAGEWLSNDFTRILNELKKHMFKRRKCKLNKQMRLVFNSERDTIETFIED